MGAKEPDQRDVRSALVAAAFEVLAENEDLSLREVARRVGVTHPAAYHHFKSKGALLAEVSREAFGRLDKAMGDAASGIPEGYPRERFVALGVGYVRFATANPRLFRMMFRRESEPSLIEAARPSFQRVFGAVEEACRAVASAPDPFTTTVLAWSAMHGLAALWVEGPLAAWSGEEDLEPTAQRVAYLIGRLIFEGDPS
jgi:AcrR family transcriptional regulator